MIECFIKLTLKVINQNQIGIISDNKKNALLPVIQIKDKTPFIDNIKDILNRYDIPIGWLSLTQMQTTKEDNTIFVNYTSFVPKDFLNEETLSKIYYDFNKFSTQDQMQIREALSLHHI